MTLLLWKGNIDLEVLHERQTGVEVKDMTWYPWLYLPRGCSQQVAPARSNLAPLVARETNE